MLAHHLNVLCFGSFMNKSACLHGCKREHAALAAMLELISPVARQGFAAPGWRPPLTRLCIVPSPLRDGLGIVVAMPNMPDALRVEIVIVDAVIRRSSQIRGANFVMGFEIPPASLPRCAR